ncbi:uncharacterized protein LOC109810947 [Cajanus cajan]|uniref:uncharacterized protein LOC109810947 n=1 Tax=Cajanus cajan TaxID=3821 RepID=UPI00098DC712|nr:uncharacterized protein LOC109810947 [Cajanus cajan]
MAERHSVSDNHDPYAFLFDLSQLSSSQEQLLRDAPFFSYNRHLTTPEESLPPSGDGQRRTTTTPVDVEARGDVLGKIRDGERAPSDLGESPMKKSKLSKEGLGNDASGVQLQKGKEEEGKVPPSKRRGLEDAAYGSKCGSSGEKNKFSLYDVLKVILEECSEVGDILKTMKSAESCGLSFPRPRWWPEDFKLFE